MRRLILPALLLVPVCALAQIIVPPMPAEKRAAFEACLAQTNRDEHAVLACLRQVDENAAAPPPQTPPQTPPPTTPPTTPPEAPTAPETTSPAQALTEIEQPKRENGIQRRIRELVEERNAERAERQRLTERLLQREAPQQSTTSQAQEGPPTLEAFAAAIRSALPRTSRTK